MEVNWYRRAATQEELEHANILVVWDRYNHRFVGDGGLKKDPEAGAGIFHLEINPKDGAVEAGIRTDPVYSLVVMEIRFPWETLRIKMFPSEGEDSWTLTHKGVAQSSLRDVEEIKSQLQNAHHECQVTITGYEEDPDVPLPAVELRTRRKRWK